MERGWHSFKMLFRIGGASLISTKQVDARGNIGKFSVARL